MYEELGRDRGICVDFLSQQGLSTLKNFKSHLLLRYTEHELLSFFEHGTEPLSIPVCIFSKKLSLLEAIVKYLKENREFGFAEIARLLNRAPSTISTTYAKGKKKMPRSFVISESKSVPISIIANRKVSTFEAIVLYLHKDNTITEIANLTKRDNRVVWDIHRRAVKKLSREKFFASIKSPRDIGVLKKLRESIEQRYAVDFVKLFKSIPEEELIPIQIFKRASPLQALVSYLKQGGWSTKNISQKLNRSPSVISAAVFKIPEVDNFTHSVALAKLADRNFSIMENVVHTLLEQGLKIGEIAEELDRSQAVISKFKQRWKRKSEKL